MTLEMPSRPCSIDGGYGEEYSETTRSRVTAIGCPPAGDTIFMAYMNHEIDGTVSTTTQGMQSGTSPEMGSAVWTGDVKAYETKTL